MDRWTEDEDAILAECVSEGMPWKEIADHLPGRTVSAAQARWSLRGEVMPAHPDREAPHGVGRPRNTKPTLALHLRLDRSVADAFAGAIDLKPRHRLAYALERYLEGESFELEGKIKPRVLERGERIAVRWGVDVDLLDRAAKKSGLSRPKTAELAIVQLLEGWGFTLVESDAA